MRAPFIFSAMIALPLFFFGSASLAQNTPATRPVHDRHDHQHDEVDHKGHAHRPPGVAEGEHAHAHPHVDLHHGIVTESPVPETHISLNYTAARPSEGNGLEHSFTAALQYAFVPEFSVEVAVPYAVIDPEGSGARGGLEGIEVTGKWATYQFTHMNLLPSVGLGVTLPAGDEERGIGSDHVFDVESFFRVGYWRGRFQAVAEIGIGVPLNRSRAERMEDEDFSVGYSLALFYEVTPRVQALLEIHGESAFGGADGDGHALYLSPGVTFQPLQDKSVNFGVGVSVPVTNDRDFDFAVNLFAIVHL